MKKISPAKMMLIGVTLLATGFLFDEGFFVRNFFHVIAVGIVIVAWHCSLWFDSCNKDDRDPDHQ